MKKKHKTNRSLNVKNISIIYKTEKQFWCIFKDGTKKRISKKKFKWLVTTKKLISYQDSKVLNNNRSVTVVNDKIVIHLNHN